MDNSPKSFAEALHEEHTALLADLHQLDDAVHAGSRASPMELGTRLTHLRTHLLEHFRFEEEGGYMAPVLHEEPRLGPEIQGLLDEHGQLAQTLDALIQEASAAQTLDDGLREKVRGWAKRVRQHEAHENNLVQEAYYSAGATGD